MAKRFTETEKWKDPWFRKLSVNSKLLWFFLTENCDSAGFWKKDYELATFFCGYDVTEEHLLTAFNNGKERVINHGIYVEIPDFVPFQYGHLSNDCRPHKPIIDLLEKYRKKGYRKGIDTLEEQEQEQEKEKEAFKNTINAPEKSFNQIEAFRALWAQYPGRGRLYESESLRVFCETVISRDKFSRILKSLGNYTAHLRANDWKQPKSFLNWFEEWPEWENRSVELDHGDRPKSAIEKLKELREKRVSEATG